MTKKKSCQPEAEALNNNNNNNISDILFEYIYIYIYNNIIIFITFRRIVIYNLVYL